MRTKLISLSFVLVLIAVLVVPSTFSITTTLRPNAAGTFQGWTPYGTGSTHWGRVSDESWVTGVNITANIVLNETFGFTNLPANASAWVDNVTAIMTCNVTVGGGGGETAAIKIYNGTAWNESAAKSISRAAKTNYSQLWNQLSNASVNAMEIGSRATALGAGESIACVEYYLVVNYNETAPSTCTYGGSGNWNVNCADNCVFSSSTTLAGANNVTITGTGTLTFASGGKWIFTGLNQYLNIDKGCTLAINSGGGWNT